MHPRGVRSSETTEVAIIQPIPTYHEALQAYSPQKPPILDMDTYHEALLRGLEIDRPARIFLP
jgi:hypothetical protein